MVTLPVPLTSLFCQNSFFKRALVSLFPFFPFAFMALKYEVSFSSDFTSSLLLPCTYLYFSIYSYFLKAVWSRIEMAMGRIVVSITSLPYPMSWWLLISNKLLAGPSKYYSSLVISNLGILAYAFTFLLLSQFHHPNLVFLNSFFPYSWLVSILLP